MNRSQVSAVKSTAFALQCLLLIICTMTSRSFLLLNIVQRAQFICDTRSRLFSRTMRHFCAGTVLGEKDDNINLERKWDIKGLKLEVNRSYMRTFKKVGKANEKLTKALVEYNDIINTPDASQERMEECPNPEILQADLNMLQQTLSKLSYLEEELKSVKSTGNEKFPALASLAEELGVSDVPPPAQERGPKKVKAKPASGPRKPYHVYTGLDGIEIRVGRGAEDNDELSCNPAHRDGPDWWLHVAGCPGSHVVIRSHEDLLPEKFKETLLDAAVLAVINSKGSQSGRVPVTFTRCRHVTKPGGAKPGLVFLGGDVSTIKIDVKAEALRIERLEKTKQG
jgi:predicted ribosome quality control (RQC) complex YloA/Tae2 family protein